ncbi:MAG: hypothetical protein K2W95_31560 [Candidatus Obscuribacterales bacterium]|nr:hypothetical protein [Candidatus Obscuribacterales bacterium]
MPLFANVVGDVIFIALVFLVIGFVYVMANLPGWIGAAGGSLGLWQWKASEPQVNRVREAIALLSARANELSTQGREEVKQAQFALDRALKANGFRAGFELSESVRHCTAAVLGCTPDLVKEVHGQLGVVSHA